MVYFTSMPKAELKTKASDNSVEDFINGVKDPIQRSDSKVILELMEKVTRSKAKMWGTSIIGFKDIHLKYASGRELDWFKMGFSPRKRALTLYVLNKPSESFEKYLPLLGKHSIGKGCLYIKQLSDIDLDVLKKILVESAK